MPIKSQAQRRKFAELLVNGEITPEVYERWNREAGSKELPERLHPEKKPKRKTAAKRTAKPKPRKKRATKAKKAGRRSATR